MRNADPSVGSRRADLKVSATPNPRIGAIMAALSKAEIRERLMNMPEWSLIDSAIYRKFTFKSFLPAIAFVNKIAEAAEQANHHPDITINYNQVGISLSTHSESGVTEKDFHLAEAIDKLYE
jgi:4a-hydroxytetrahydrobiopterin dehydratase